MRLAKVESDRPIWNKDVWVGGGKSVKQQFPDAGRLLADARYQQGYIPLAHKCADAEVRRQTCDGQFSAL